MPDFAESKVVCSKHQQVPLTLCAVGDLEDRTKEIRKVMCI